MTVATKKRELTPAQEYNANFAKVVARLARTRKSAFTVDDVVKSIGNPPQGSKALGALMNAAAYNLDLTEAGVKRATRPSRRGALNRAWIG